MFPFLFSFFLFLHFPFIHSHLTFSFSLSLSLCPFAAKRFLQIQLWAGKTTKSFDRYKHVQGANIANIAVKFVNDFRVWDYFTRYCSNSTKVWYEFLTPSTLAFSCEVVHEQLWKSVCIRKSYGEKSVAPFYVKTLHFEAFWYYFNSPQNRCCITNFNKFVLGGAITGINRILENSKAIIGPILRDNWKAVKDMI